MLFFNLFHGFRVHLRIVYAISLPSHPMMYYVQPQFRSAECTSQSEAKKRSNRSKCYQFFRTIAAVHIATQKESTE